MNDYYIRNFYINEKTRTIILQYNAFAFEGKNPEQLLLKVFSQETIDKYNIKILESSNFILCPKIISVKKIKHFILNVLEPYVVMQKLRGKQCEIRDNYA